MPEVCHSTLAYYPEAEVLHYGRDLLPGRRYTG